MEKLDTQKKIVTLYKKLKENSITDHELNELFILVEKEENKKNLDAELEEVWDSLRSIEEVGLSEQKSRLRKKLKRKTHPVNMVIKSNWKYGIAATVTIVIAVGIFLNDMFSTSIEFSTEYGERQTILLPDGSQVELNANSSIIWDKNWEKNKVRKIQLLGEAYFEVIHLDQDQKFIVSTSDLDIEVLGTSFNVSDRSNMTDVFLSEGSVKLGLKGKINKEIIMDPGQRISYSKEENKVVKHEENNALAASWKNNVLYFNDKTVEETLQKVSQIYGVEFEFRDPSIKSLKLNFYVPYKDWSVAKEAFELTMNLKIDLQENGKYLISKK
ncbi:FecR family protein [Membranihabitans maritimus]|uniref:FecR family protein n=1 Tax=Membranihabitans maritimus TaxID=2904244 RepID=UPI001F3F8926|nr:FecR domain-containing protein [Membranihabitans maritimus]